MNLLANGFFQAGSGGARDLLKGNPTGTFRFFSLYVLCEKLLNAKNESVN